MLHERVVAIEIHKEKKAHKTWNIFYLALHRKRFLTPALDFRETFIYIHTEKCIRIFFATVFDKKLDISFFSPIGEWINKMYFLYAVDYNIVIKITRYLWNNQHISTWINLNILVSRKQQVSKYTYYFNFSCLVPWNNCFTQWSSGDGTIRWMWLGNNHFLNVTINGTTRHWVIPDVMHYEI